MGIKGKYVGKFKSSIQCFGFVIAEKEIIFCKDRFTNSNETVGPIDLLCKCWSCKLQLCRDSPASVSVCLNSPLFLSHMCIPHLPLTTVKFCLIFFCYLCSYRKINLYVCIAHEPSRWTKAENKDKLTQQHLRMTFSHIRIMKWKSTVCLVHP